MGQAVIPQDTRILVGWREWVSLPELGIRAVKAKVDTGARSSALPTCELLAYREQGRDMVRFSIHPLQKHTDTVIVCRAPVIDRRWVSDSGGHRELRYVISTPLHLGPHVWPIEITLTPRDPMRFRMLLGRTAMENRLQVLPNASYLVGRPPAAAH
ncbi:MAG: ATP-dependent zinc protease [Gammaproteobacteria bacterium]|nr:ATP-dependent zinc protease [Gammaproteobacteria bacterium]